MPGMAGSYGPLGARAGALLAAEDRRLLMVLQKKALRYFLDNQLPNGLVLDRQSNLGDLRPSGICSTSATGMGLIALALASSPTYGLLTPEEAAGRVGRALRTALDRLPRDGGMFPHFVFPESVAPWGDDPVSTIDSSWLVAGGLWASAFLGDRGLWVLAEELYDRIDWAYWSAPMTDLGPGQIRHGKGRDGGLLGSWDRLNGETIFMYVLAAGAREGRHLPAESYRSLQTFDGTAGGIRFNNADLGLFVFQYGMDLLDLRRWRSPVGPDLWAEAALAAAANREVCRGAASDFATYEHYWGLSAGDGPGAGEETDTYQIYSPSGPIDGTAHLTATLASVSHDPEGVLENLRRASDEQRLAPLGRYGFSNVNLDRRWVGRDMVGIDAGAAILAVDNYLQGDRVRLGFHGLPMVQKGLERLGFVPPPAARRAS
jgi:hypothetical protein